METMTSSFPSSARNHTRAQIDNIIFYTGPASAMTREPLSTNADKWPDIDMIFAEAAQQEWTPSIERLDPTGGIDITSKGEFWSWCLYSGLPFNTREIRHLECGRYKRCSAGGSLYPSTLGGR